MNKINLEKYIYQIVSLGTFYRYSRGIFENKGIRNEIKKQEMNSMLSTAESFKSLKIDALEFVSNYKNKIEENVDKNIDKGISILRQQILVSSHTIFENFLCNVVRVYLNIFPIILKEKDKSIYFRDIVDLKDNNSIFNYIIEKEVNDFSRLSLEEKKVYLSKRLKILNQMELWKIDKEDLLKEIDEKRHSIVHDDNPTEITEEELFKYLYYFQRIIFGLSMNAKIYQGIDFILGNISEQIPGKEKPNLK